MMSTVSDTQMDCPKCPGKLKEIAVDGVKVDFCWVCEGIWFDAGELQKVIANDARNLKLDQLGHADLDGEELVRLRERINTSTGYCPRCPQATALKKEPYEANENLEIDVCPRGHGLWLDGGEVQLLRRRTLANVLHVWDHFVSWAKLKLSGKIK